MATTLRRPAPAEPPSRAAQRKQRLLELENEQRLEDAEALKMTEEQRLSLFQSFRSVKFEWSDLDGMRSVRRRYNSPSRLQLAHPPPAPVSPHPQPAPVSPPQHAQTPAFAVLTNARLASFRDDDTICVRSSRLPPQSHAHPTPYLSPPRSAPSPRSPNPPHCHSAAPKSRKTRSPVKGLFAFPAPPAPSSPYTHTSIRVPRPPLIAPTVPAEDGEGDEDEDEDAWVDEDDEDDDGDQDGEGEEEDESALATPVPRWGAAFGDGVQASFQIERPHTPAPGDSPVDAPAQFVLPPAGNVLPPTPRLAYPHRPLPNPDTYAQIPNAHAYAYVHAPAPAPAHAQIPNARAVGGKRKR